MEISKENFPQKNNPEIIKNTDLEAQREEALKCLENELRFALKGASEKLTLDQVRQKFRDLLRDEFGDKMDVTH